MSARKVYARLALTEAELALVKSSISATLSRVTEKAVHLPPGEPPEAADFYRSRAIECGVLLHKIQAIYAADHSQDAEPDDDEDDAEEDDA